MDIVLCVDGIVFRVAVEGLFDSRVVGNEGFHRQALGLIAVPENAAVGPDFDQGAVMLLSVVGCRGCPVDTAGDGEDEEVDGAGFENREEDIFLLSGEHSSPRQCLMGRGKPGIDGLDVDWVAVLFCFEGGGHAEPELQVAVDGVILQRNDVIPAIGRGRGGWIG